MDRVLVWKAAGLWMEQAMRLRVGIDIGADGAIALFHDTNGIVHLDYCKLARVANELNAAEIAKFILQYDTEDCHVVIEDLHSVFGSSAKSNFAFGGNNGLIIGMLQMLQVPYTKVAPKAWQKLMWQGIRPVEIDTGKKKKDGSIKYKTDTKATSLIAAQRLFPRESFLATDRSKVPHNGIVDAVLMAEYCRRNF